MALLTIISLAIILPAAIIKGSFLSFMLIKEIPLYLFKEAFMISAGFVLADYRYLLFRLHRSESLSVARYAYVF